MLVGGAGLAGHHDSGVAGRKPDQEEIEDNDREQDDHALEDTLGDEGEHFRESYLVAGATVTVGSLAPLAGRGSG